MIVHQEKIDAAMIAQLQDLLGGRFAELVQRFVEDGMRRLNLLRAAVRERDFDAIYTEAHGLKGSSRNIGANPLGNYCAELEAKGRVGEAHALEPLFAAVEQEFAAVCEVLHNQLH